MRFYKAMLWKAYFDQGYGTTSYVKYLIGVLGIANTIITEDLRLIIILGVSYGLFCLIVGRLWFKFKLVDAEHEVQNVVNPFVSEMRKVFKVKDT